MSELRNYTNYKIIHTLREGNKEVDKLVNWDTSFKNIRETTFEYFRNLNLEE